MHQSGSAKQESDTGPQADRHLRRGKIVEQRQSQRIGNLERGRDPGAHRGGQRDSYGPAPSLGRRTKLRRQATHCRGKSFESIRIAGEFLGIGDGCGRTAQCKPEGENGTACLLADERSTILGKSSLQCKQTRLNLHVAMLPKSL